MKEVDQDCHHKAKELDSGFDGDPSGGFDAELSSYGKQGICILSSRPAGGRRGLGARSYDISRAEEES